MKKHNSAVDTAVQYSLKNVSEISANPRNARTHSKAQINKIAQSIRKFGFIAPVIIGDDGVLLAGHGRLEAAVQLGLTEIPCVLASHLSDADKRAYMLADNRIQLDSGWDDDLLKIELGELSALDFDIEVTGFDLSEIDEILGIEKSREREDDVPALPTNPIVRLGETWLLGAHKLRCGDSTSADDVAALMGGGDGGYASH